MARTKTSTKKPAGKSPKAKKSGGGKKAGGAKRRFKPGTVALREIRRIQKSGALLVKKAPFGRLVREITKPMKSGIKFRRAALAAVQEAAEAHATSTLEAAVLLQLHRKRKTLVQKDIEYVRRIKGEILDA